MNRGRLGIGWYAASLLLWYCAFATYTFQVGAIVGIALLSLLRPSGKTPGRAVLATFIETAPFALLLSVFILTWRTTQNPAMAGYYAVQWGLLPKNLLLSFAFGASPTRYLPFAKSALLEHPLLTVCWSALVGLAGAAAFLLISRRASLASVRDCFLTVLVAVGLVLPTAMIESISLVWSLGLRWPMVDQAWQPLLWMSLAFMAIAFLPASSMIKRALQAAVVGAALFGVVAVSFGYNIAQNRFSASENALKTGLTSAALPSGDDPNIIVLVDPSVQLAVPDAMSGRIASVWFPGRNVGLRILAKGALPLEPAHESWWRVGFFADRVENVRIGGGRSDLSAVAIFRFDGKSVEPVTRLRESDIAGYPAQWHRTEDLYLPEASP